MRCYDQPVTTDPSAADMPEELRRLLQPELKELVATLQHKDDLLPMLLRFHLLTESLLERLIVAKLPGGHVYLDNVSPTYHQKLELVNAFDVAASECIGALRKLNKLRNASAHVKGHSIVLGDIDAIGRPLGKSFIANRRKHGADVGVLLLTVVSEIFTLLLMAVYAFEHPDIVVQAKSRTDIAVRVPSLPPPLPTREQGDD